MRFRVLGPLEVEADDGPVALGGPKERLLLALLLTRPNRVVSVEALVRGLWGEQPPPTAAKTLQSHVKRLRRALEPDRARGATGEVLITHQPGYLLRVAPGALDATRFEELAAKARPCACRRRGPSRRVAAARGAGAVAGAGIRGVRWTATSRWPRPTGWPSCGWSPWRIASRPTCGWVGIGSWWPSWRGWSATIRCGSGCGPSCCWRCTALAGRPMRCWPTSGPGRSWSRSSASTRGRSCAGCTRPSWPRIPGWTCRRRPKRAGPGSSRRRLTPVGPVFVGRAAELAWLRAAWTRAAQGRGGAVLVAGMAGHGQDPTRRSSSPKRSTTRAGGCCTAAAPRQRPTRCSRSWTHSRASAHPNRTCMRPAPASPWQPVAGRSPTCWPVGPTRRCCWYWMTSTSPRSQRWRQLPVLRPRPSPGGCWCWAPTGRRRPGGLGLAERLDPSGAARRRLGPFGREEVAQVLSLYESRAGSTGCRRRGPGTNRRPAAAGAPDSEGLGPHGGRTPGGAGSQADRHQP